MRYRLVTGIIFAVAVIAAGTPSAYAHVLTNDGQIGGVLHIEPDDSAVSGVPTEYMVEFSDTSHRLDLTRCDCKATVTQDGRPVSRSPFTASSTVTGVNTLTFPTPGVYVLTLSGAPTAGSDFQAFSLDFTIRATAAGAPAASEFPPLLTIGIAASVALIILGALVREYTTSTPNKKE